ncbi:MAG: hypothetical protein Q9178_002493 [Gyalolechia marmorata]
MPPTESATERSPLLGEPSSPSGNTSDAAITGSPTDAESTEQASEPESPEILQARKNVKYMLPIFGVGIFLAFLDQSIVAAINGDIGSDLNALRSVSWIATAYFLTMTCSQPLYGKLSDVFGRKPCLLAFLIQVFLCLIALFAVSVFLHPPQHKTDISWTKQLKRIDFLGALLLILAVFGILFGLDRGSNVSWRSPITIVSLCSTLPFVLAFLWVETRFALEPFTPGHVIFDKALCACYVQNFFGYASFTAFIFYIPFFFQVVLEMTPAQAGAGLIPAAVSAVVGTLLGGIIIKRIGKFYWLALIASIVGTATAVLLAAAPSLRQGSNIVVYAASVATFVPQGITITASLIAIISNVSPADQAVATACSFLFRSLGAAVGVSLVGLVIQQVLGMKLRARLDPDQAEQILKKVGRSLDFIKDLPPDLRSVVEGCYSDGIQSGFIMCVALLAVSTLSIIWWREKKMSN